MGMMGVDSTIEHIAKKSLDEKFPNALILSGEIPQTRWAGAIVLHRLFAEYPAERLFVVGPQPHEEAEVLQCPYRELRMPFARFENTRFSVYKRSLAACGWIPLPSHRRTLHLLEGFKPEMVVSVMANTPWILTAERTARLLRIPLVLIIHDLNEEFEMVFRWAKRGLYEQNRQVYRSAVRRLCVSPEMVDYLAQRYGVEGEVMYPNRGEEVQSLHFDRGKFDILKDERDRRLTLGYAGSLAYGYGEALVELIPVLREVGARILISTPRPPEKLKELLVATDVVEWMPHRADINAMWREMQERTDVMILPYSNPAEGNELLYRTHFPSKLTEYLALGMPVVVSGPEFATGVRYARGEKLKGEKTEKLKSGNAERGALFQRFSISEFLNFAPNGAVSCTSREELTAVLKTLKENGEVRRDLARRAVEAGVRDFDPVKIRERFITILGDVAGKC